MHFYLQVRNQSVSMKLLGYFFLLNRSFRISIIYIKVKVKNGHLLQIQMKKKIFDVFLRDSSATNTYLSYSNVLNTHKSTLQSQCHKINACLANNSFCQLLFLRSLSPVYNVTSDYLTNTLFICAPLMTVFQQVSSILKVHSFMSYIKDLGFQCLGWALYIRFGLLFISTWLPIRFSS